MTNGNVLPLETGVNGGTLPIFSPPSQKTFREAVSKVIRTVKSDFDLTNAELAERLGCCKETIANAENRENDLSAMYLLRIAFHFGEKAIDPVRGLYLCQVAEAKTTADLLREALARVEAA